MTLDDIFNLGRFQLQLKRHMFLTYKNMLRAFVAISGILIVIGVLTSINNQVIHQHSFIALSYVALFLGGHILTSHIFNELNKTESAMHYLTLPSSNLEKVLSAYLISTVFFLLVAVSFFYAAFYVASLFALLLTGSELAMINFFDHHLLRIAAIYLLVHPIFFLGAVSFKGYNFIKTLLAIFLVLMAHSIIQSILGYAILGRPFTMEFDYNGANFSGMESFVFDTLVPTAKVLAFVVPVFLLVVSYIKFQEREV